MWPCPGLPRKQWYSQEEQKPCSGQWPQLRGIFPCSLHLGKGDQAPPSFTAQVFLPLTLRRWGESSCFKTAPAIFPPTPQMLSACLGLRPLLWPSSLHDDPPVSGSQASASHSGPQRGPRCSWPVVLKAVDGLLAAAPTGWPGPAARVELVGGHKVPLPLLGPGVGQEDS